MGRLRPSPNPDPSNVASEAASTTQAKLGVLASVFPRGMKLGFEILNSFVAILGLIQPHSPIAGPTRPLKGPPACTGERQPRNSRTASCLSYNSARLLA